MVAAYRIIRMEPGCHNAVHAMDSIHIGGAICSIVKVGRASEIEVQKRIWLRDARRRLRGQTPSPRIASSGGASGTVISSFTPTNGGGSQRERRYAASFSALIETH